MAGSSCGKHEFSGGESSITEYSADSSMPCNEDTT